MKQSLQLKLGQSLTMTPQLQQAIRLLQLSSMELHGEIQEVLESNMMLELDNNEEQDSAGGDSEAETGENRSEENQEVATSNDIPEELPVDTVWDDIYDTQASYSRPREQYEYSGYENQDSSEKTLDEHLLWQLNLSAISDTDRTIAIAIIDALDDDGYLTCSLEDIHRSVDLDEVEMDEIEAVLHMVQALDPTGVAARDLRECLSLQMRQLDPQTSWLAEAKTLVDNHLQLLAAHDHNQLMRKMKLEQEQLLQVVNLIRSMNPRPANQVQQTRTEYVVPDVFVKKENGVWRVELNTDTIPRLRINPGYANMIRRADNSADNTSLKSHLQEARWFIKSLQSRSETLLRVATGIVERQRAFLEYGEEAMKPLVLHDIADSLGMHESTISRVTNKKYMHTPRGIFELKYFFSSHVGTEQGGACSSTAIRALLKKLIQAEKPEKPFSDNKLAGLLSEQGIKVARRTVAKYREAMSIPPSNERKRLV
ncbi:MAG: RNA polymerase factor sigma-54 [Gammaproteobacteria bacterium]